MQLKNSTVLKMQLKNTYIENVDFEENFTSYLQGSFIYATVWGFGGTLDSKSQSTFDHYLKQLLKSEIIGLEPPKDLSPISVIIPSEGMLYDYVYNCTLRGSWKHFNDIVSSSKIEENRNIEQTLVHTLDTAR